MVLDQISLPEVRQLLAKVVLASSTLTVAVAGFGTANASEGHVVAPGETLWTIAGQYGIGIEDLATANGISNVDYVWSGQVLRIPDAVVAGASASAAALGYHTVSAGDSLTGIAQRYGTTIGQLSEINSLTNPDYIYIGQTLRVPNGGSIGGSATVSAAAVGVTELNRTDAQLAVIAAEQEFGIPTGLYQALTWQESGWQTGVVSSAGAIGLGQVMPGTGQWVVDYLLPDAADWATNPYNNARVGAAYLRYLLDLTGWDVYLSLAAYYQGLTNIWNDGYYEDTVQYVANVLYFQNWYR